MADLSEFPARCRKNFCYINELGAITVCRIYTTGSGKSDKSNGERDSVPLLREIEWGSAMVKNRMMAPWPPATATITVSPAPARAADPLKDCFLRVSQAEQLRQQGKFDRARQICESLIREHPDYVAAHHTLGLIHADKKNYDRAFDHLSRAAMLNPRGWKTLTVLASVCLDLNANDMALLALEQARAIKPQDAVVLVTLAEVYRQEREYERAKEAFREAVAIEDNLLPAIMGLGWMCMELGQNAEAVDVFESLIKRGTSALAVIFALTGMPSSYVNIDLIAELDKLPRDQIEGERESEQLAAFVRVNALDKAGRHAEAWQHLVSVNRTIFLAAQESFRNSSERQRTSLAMFRENPMKALNDSGNSGRPISLFILGPSRSGKTTMEQLVTTLDGVKRGYENPSVEKAVRRTFQSAGLLTSNQLEMLPPYHYPQCRDIYLEELAQRVGPARVFTNTHPAHIHAAPLMASTFPNARFIFLKRNTTDNILRIFQRKYHNGNAYSYDLKATSEYVAWYHQMIDLMAQKLPDIVRVVHYEDMIADPAAALQVAADLCGLPMTDKPLPKIGDDRGCAEPYREFMATALN